MKTNDAELQELRIAVATAEGWVFCSSHDNPLTNSAVPDCWIHDDYEPAWDISQLPNYTGSRDAIFDACNRRFKTLEERIRFVVEICKEIGSILNFPEATPEQLCRAYLAAAGIPATP